MSISMRKERKKSKKVRNLLRGFCARLGLGHMEKNEDYFAVLEEKIAKQGRLLDISEAQKRRLKRENAELRRKISEILRNSS